MTADPLRMAAGGQPEQPSGGQPPPRPDEDGPHDVPDDKVIEETLPRQAPQPRHDAGQLPA